MSPSHLLFNEGLGFWGSAVKEWCSSPRKLRRRSKKTADCVLVCPSLSVHFFRLEGGSGNKISIGACVLCACECVCVCVCACVRACVRALGKRGRGRVPLLH